MPNLEAEWMQVIKERDMAVKAIMEFLDDLDSKPKSDIDDELCLVHIQKWEGCTDGYTRVSPDDEPPSLVMLRRIRDHLEKKLNR